MNRNTSSNSIGTIVFLAIIGIIVVCFMFYEKGVFTTNDTISSNETLESIDEMNSSVNELLGEALEAKLAYKLETGEITDEMIENMSSDELFYAVMAD